MPNVQQPYRTGGSLWVTIVLLSVVVCVSALHQNTRWHELESKHYNFQQFIQEYTRTYATPEEYIRRQNIFNANLAQILSHNRKNSSWKAGVNQFTDWTSDEFRAVLGYRHHDKRRLSIKPRQHTVTLQEHERPPSVDWRNRGAVSPVKNQGNCGSCWAFSSAQTLESFWYIRTGYMTSLSPQQIASCTILTPPCKGEVVGGCNGGFQVAAFTSLIQQGGLTSEWQYPYISFLGTNFWCFNSTNYNSYTFPVAKMSHYAVIESNSYDALMDAVITQGPVSVSVDASLWNSYESGVYDGCNATSPSIDHAVQLVGYGEEDSVGYWIVRNSWAATWGEFGYIRLKRTQKPSCGYDPSATDCDGGPTHPKVCGECGILYDNSFPIIN